MPNTLLTPVIIANELLMRFKNNLPFASGASHEYDAKFDKIGDSYTLRDPVRFVANTGADITALIQDVVELGKILRIDTQNNVAFSFPAKDLTLTIDRFAERYLDSAAVSLANAFDIAGLTLAAQSCPNVVGTPGTAPNTAAVILEAGVKMDNNATPVDGQRKLVLNPAAQAAEVDALKGLFQSSEKIAAQYTRGRMGTALGFDWAMSQNVRTHTVGAWGTTPVLAGAVTSGATTLSMTWTGSATGVAKKGDKFTLANVFAVNPVSGDALTKLQEFTVTADTTAVGSAITALPIYPPIITSGPRRTVVALPASNAPMTLVGTTSTGYAANIAYHKHAFCYAMARLEEPKGTHMAKTAVDEDAGLSIRMVSDYNILTDVFVTRCDTLYGWCARRPEWACVIAG